jgi:hypothetical protein
MSTACEESVAGHRSRQPLGLNKYRRVFVCECNENVWKRSRRSWRGLSISTRESTSKVFNVKDLLVRAVLPQITVVSTPRRLFHQELLEFVVVTQVKSRHPRGGLLVSQDEVNLQSSRVVGNGTPHLQHMRVRKVENTP